MILEFAEKADFIDSLTAKTVVQADIDAALNNGEKVFIMFNDVPVEVVKVEYTETVAVEV